MSPWFRMPSEHDARRCSRSRRLLEHLDAARCAAGLLHAVVDERGRVLVDVLEHELSAVRLALQARGHAPAGGRGSPDPPQSLDPR